MTIVSVDVEVDLDDIDFDVLKDYVLEDLTDDEICRERDLYSGEDYESLEEELEDLRGLIAELRRDMSNMERLE